MHGTILSTGHSPLPRPATFHAPPPPCETPPELSPRTDYLDSRISEQLQTGKGSFIFPYSLFCTSYCYHYHYCVSVIILNDSISVYTGDQSSFNENACDDIPEEKGKIFEFNVFRIYIKILYC